MKAAAGILSMSLIYTEAYLNLHFKIQV